jgi:uncharacterized protein YndB with AHSA1/START domain
VTTQKAPIPQPSWFGGPFVRGPSDLRVGGSYRIANRMPDGSTLWIAGEFELIEPPSRLMYTWRLEIPEASTERVSVSFVPRDTARSHRDS